MSCRSVLLIDILEEKDCLVIGNWPGAKQLYTGVTGNFFGIVGEKAGELGDGGGQKGTCGGESGTDAREICDDLHAGAGD